MLSLWGSARGATGQGWKGRSGGQEVAGNTPAVAGTTASEGAHDATTLAGRGLWAEERGMAAPQHHVLCLQDGGFFSLFRGNLTNCLKVCARPCKHCLGLGLGLGLGLKARAVVVTGRVSGPSCICSDL